MKFENLIKAIEPAYNWLLLKSVELEIEYGSIIAPDSENSFRYLKVLKTGPGTKEGEEAPCGEGDYVMCQPEGLVPIGPGIWMAPWVAVVFQLNKGLVDTKLIKLH